MVTSNTYFVSSHLCTPNITHIDVLIAFTQACAASGIGLARLQLQCVSFTTSAGQLQLQLRRTALNTWRVRFSACFSIYNPVPAVTPQRRATKHACHDSTFVPSGYKVYKHGKRSKYTESQQAPQAPQYKHSKHSTHSHHGCIPTASDVPSVLIFSAEFRLRNV